MTKGVGFIGKSNLQTATRLPKVTSMAWGAAILAASFFILRCYRRNRLDFESLERRVEELEYDRLYEAYKKCGLC